MHFMYVDESGDPGDPAQSTGSTERYVRVGLVVHAWKWKALDAVISGFKRSHGLEWNDELRANDIRGGGGAFKAMSSDARYALLGNLLDTIGRELHDVRVLAVCIDKRRVDRSRKDRLSRPEVRSMELLLEKYNDFLGKQRDHCGIVVLDECERKHDENIRYFQNYLRTYSPRIDSRRILEGTLFLPSDSSNLLQVADVCANVFYRRYRWDEAATREFAKIEERFEVVEWPRQK